MNAFISYSHQDAAMLDLLHKHLAQLQRDNTIKAWKDRDILAGSTLDPAIDKALAQSKLFLALLSPDYIASRYCYEIEFQTALARQKQGDLTIVPIILEPCDWQATPFKDLKALPNDGRAISLWDNKNTAFLDVIQNLRKLANAATAEDVDPQSSTPGSISLSRNYKIKKDFDTITKMEFIEGTFREVTSYLKRFIQEVNTLEGIKTRSVSETDDTFEYLLVNRNKTETEARLTVSIDTGKKERNTHSFVFGEFSYNIKATNRNTSDVSEQFSLKFDDYDLFWTKLDYFNQRQEKKFDAKTIADLIYDKWLESVGIL